MVVDTNNQISLKDYINTIEIIQKLIDLDKKIDYWFLFIQMDYTFGGLIAVDKCIKMIQLEYRLSSKFLSGDELLAIKNIILKQLEADSNKLVDNL